ncbi:odorant receptor coreceptor-like [Periplaneta americana]|uniref:odorant receptor coreceptor-like n=1 Tax=Periplaneta americana TaxID=6978 RepID=UPI0037E983E2
MFRLSLYIIGTPYAYVTFVTVACTQLQKVKDSLLKMKAISESEQSEDGRCNKEKVELRMQEEFNDIVRLHQEVISYINTLEDMMCLLLGGILFFILALQCTAAFAAVMSLERKNDLSRAVYLYLTVTFAAVIYCGFGTVLSQEYESVSNAAISSDWVGTPVSFQKCISFMIAISNRGFTLTAAKFVPVSNSTLMSMINESISLFMFLLTMKDKND